MSPISEYGLHLDLPREPRFVARGVPVVELWVSGKDHVFHRVTGICDSGASRTLLAARTFERLRLKIEVNDRMHKSNALTREINYKRQLVHVRIASGTQPPIHIALLAGLTRDIEENLFGSDLLAYFGLLVTTERVTLLADPLAKE
jgi:hypothetical protein